MRTTKTIYIKLLAMLGLGAVCSFGMFLYSFRPMPRIEAKPDKPSDDKHALAHPRAILTANKIYEHDQEE